MSEENPYRPDASAVRYAHCHICGAGAAIYKNKAECSKHGFFTPKPVKIKLQPLVNRF